MLLVQSATEVQDLSIPGVPAANEIEGVCGRPKERAELQQEQGMLTGVRLLSSTADNPEVEPKWTQTGSIVFEKGRYVEHHAGK